MDNYYDFCLRENQWRCQNIDSSIKLNESISGHCAGVVKSDLLRALKEVLIKDEFIYARLYQCADYAHPSFEKEVEDSSCENFEKEVRSFFSQEENFKELKGLLQKPESIGFCLKSFPK